MSTPTFTHPALFYRGQDEYLAGTVPFILEGVVAGEPVAVAVPGPNLELLRSELGDTLAEVLLLDMTVAGRNPGRIIPGVLRAFADTHPGYARIIGEPIWAARSDTEYPACVQHEALINHAFAGRPATILCPYDVDNLAPAVLADAEATHPVLVDATGTRYSDAYAPDLIVAKYNEPLPHPPDAPMLVFDASGLARARRFAVAQATSAGLTADRLEDLVLAVGELTTNSVVHGGGSGAMRIWLEPDRLVCEIRDAGRISDPLAGRIPAGQRQLGGRGLLLVNHVADLVRTYTGPTGTTIHVHMLLRPPPLN